MSYITTRQRPRRSRGDQASPWSEDSVSRRLRFSSCPPPEGPFPASPLVSQEEYSQHSKDEGSQHSSAEASGSSEEGYPLTTTVEQFPTINLEIPYDLPEEVFEEDLARLQGPPLDRSEFYETNAGVVIEYDVLYRGITNIMATHLPSINVASIPCPLVLTEVVKQHVDQLQMYFRSDKIDALINLFATNLTFSQVKARIIRIQKHIFQFFGFLSAELDAAYQENVNLIHQCANLNAYLSYLEKKSQLLQTPGVQFTFDDELRLDLWTEKRFKERIRDHLAKGHRVFENNRRKILDGHEELMNELFRQQNELCKIAEAFEVNVLFDEAVKLVMPSSGAQGMTVAEDYEAELLDSWMQIWLPFSFSERMEAVNEAIASTETDMQGITSEEGCLILIKECIEQTGFETGVVDYITNLKNANIKRLREQPLTAERAQRQREEFEADPFWDVRNLQDFGRHLIDRDDMYSTPRPFEDQQRIMGQSFHGDSRIQDVSFEATPGSGRSRSRDFLSTTGQPRQSTAQQIQRSRSGPQMSSTASPVTYQPNQLLNTTIQLSPIQSIRSAPRQSIQSAPRRSLQSAPRQSIQSTSLRSPTARQATASGPSQLLDSTFQIESQQPPQPKVRQLQKSRIPRLDRTRMKEISMAGARTNLQPLSPTSRQAPLSQIARRQNWQYTGRATPGGQRTQARNVPQRTSGANRQVLPAPAAARRTQGQTAAVLPTLPPSRRPPMAQRNQLIRTQPRMNRAQMLRMNRANPQGNVTFAAGANF